MVFAAIKQPFVSYYDELPSQIISIVAQSAFFTFTIAVVFSGNLPGQTSDISRPLLNAGVAALASFVHALMTPFFNKVFGPTQLNPIHEIAKSCVVGLLTSSFVSVMTTSTVNLVAFKLYYLISLNSFISWFGSSARGHHGNPQIIKANSPYLCIF
jgi:hypothetical protein